MVASGDIYSGRGELRLADRGPGNGYLLLVMNRRSVDGLLQGKFKMGADASVVEIRRLPSKRQSEKEV